MRYEILVHDHQSWLHFPDSVLPDRLIETAEDLILWEQTHGRVRVYCLGCGVFEPIAEGTVEKPILWPSPEVSRHLRVVHDHVPSWEADSPCLQGCRPSQGDVCGGPRCT